MTKIIKALSSFFSTPRGFSICLVAILLFATVSRFYRLSFPSVYYFDEVYHALTSKLIERNDPRAYEWWNEPVEPNTSVDWLHPPLAKYTQALSMKVFGENSFGWRFSSAVFGIFVIAIVALLAQTYFHNHAVTLLAAFLTSLDGLLLSQSRIAMNDIHVTFFILATVTTYGVFRNRLEKKQSANAWLLITGILSGIAMGSKWSGVYVLAAAWIAEGMRLIASKIQRRQRLIHILRMIVFLGVLPVFLYVGSYTHMFLQGKSLVCFGNAVKQGECYCSQDSSFWVKGLSALFPSRTTQFEALEARGGCKRLISHFSELQNQIWWYQTNLKATHPYESKPLQWIVDMRPVWQHVDYSRTNDGFVANIYNVGNPLLFWIGLIAILILCVLFLVHIRTKRATPLFPSSSWRVSFLLLIYFLVWAPWTFSPRIMFFYHYAPAVPLLATLTAFVLVSFWRKDKRLHLLIAGIVVAITLAYMALYPLNTGIFMRQAYFDTVFSLFPSWK